MSVESIINNVELNFVSFYSTFSLNSFVLYFTKLLAQDRSGNIRSSFSL